MNNQTKTDLAFLHTQTTQRYIPPFWYQIISVWYRHMRQYVRYWVSNALPPFLEPIIFLVGIGVGLGKYIDSMDGLPYIAYLSVGLLITVSMFTAAFECTYATFYRLKFDKVYALMLAAPLRAHNLLLGEILWASSKGFFFSTSVLIVMLFAGILGPTWTIFLAPFIGFLNAAMFAVLGHLVTSFVKTMSHFSFLFSGLLSPMFFFSGAVFPVENLPPAFQMVSEVVPLTHSVRLMRHLANQSFTMMQLWDIGYIILFIVIIGFFSTRRLVGHLID